jgi:hypothetical protein
MQKLISWRIENSMLESWIFQTSVRAFCWVVNCQNNQADLAEIVVIMHVARIVAACDVRFWVMDRKVRKQLF